MKRALILVALANAHARADEPEPIPDVALHAAAPVSRRLALDVDLVPLVTDFGKLTVDALIVPRDHHALRLAPWLAWGSTAPITVQDASGAPIMQVPEENFRAYGVELGYRYYSGLGGPRGWYVGPSFVGALLAERQAGTAGKTDYDVLGVAIDAGYTALVADRVAVSLGAGAQGLDASKSVPFQQFPSEMFAKTGVWPRVSLAIGWAFE